MPETRKTRWAALAALIAVVIARRRHLGVRGPIRGPAGPSSNAIMVVAPYWYNGTWVFDEPAVGLKREPFVAGVPEMIDVFVEDIPDAKDGFRLLFSANPFPGHQKRLTWLRGDSQATTTSSTTRRWRAGSARRCFGITGAAPRVPLRQGGGLRR